MRRSEISVVLLFSLILGCRDSTKSTTRVPPAATRPTVESAETSSPPPPPPAADANAPTPPDDPNEPKSPKPRPGMALKKAAVGAGVKGRGYGSGVITTPVRAYWTSREQITFQIHIPKAMQLFKALEGHAPRTAQEFQERIIEENAIYLPALPLGHRYVYDPKEEQLMVEHPR